MSLGRKAGILTFGATGLITGLALVTSVVLARNLGPVDRGLLLVLLFWPGLLRRFFYLSLNEATMYSVARARAEGGEFQMDLESRVALTLHLVAVGFATLASLLLLPFLLGEGRSQYLPLLLIFTVAATPLTLLDLYYNAVCQGRYRVREFNLLRLCQPVIYAAALFMLLFVEEFTVEAVLAAIVLSTSASALLGLYFEGARLPAWDWGKMLSMVRKGARIHLANMLMYLTAEIDKLIVVQWLDDAAAGLYAVALAVSLLGSGLVVQSFSILAYPKISAITEQSQQTALIRDFAQLTFLLLLLVNGVVAVVSPWLVPIVFGADFAPAVPIAMILLLMNTFKGTRQVIDRGLRATLTIRPGMVSEVVGLVGFIAFVPIGMSMGGLTGIAWAVAGSQLMALVVIVGVATHAHKLDVGDLLGLHGSTAFHLLREMWRELRMTHGQWLK